MSSRSLRAPQPASAKAQITTHSRMIGRRKLFIGDSNSTCYQQPACRVENLGENRVSRALRDPQLAQVEPACWFPGGGLASVRTAQKRPEIAKPYCPGSGAPRSSHEGPEVAGRGGGRQKSHTAAVAAPSAPAETKAAFRTLRSVGRRGT